jgi:hypothetical protein
VCVCVCVYETWVAQQKHTSLFEAVEYRSEVASFLSSPFIPGISELLIFIIHFVLYYISDLYIRAFAGYYWDTSGLRIGHRKVTNFCQDRWCRSSSLFEFRLFYCRESTKF